MTYSQGGHLAYSVDDKLIINRISIDDPDLQNLNAMLLEQINITFKSLPLPKPSGPRGPPGWARRPHPAGSC